MPQFGTEGRLRDFESRSHRAARIRGSVPVDDAIGLRSLALTSTGGNDRPIAEDDKLNQLVFVSAKIKSECQWFRQTSLVKSAVNMSGNDAIPVIFNGIDRSECHLIANDLASRPVSDSRASPKLAKLVIHQCIGGKGSHEPFNVEGIDRLYECRNGWRERGCLRCKAFSRGTGGFRHGYTPSRALRAGDAKHHR
jgi:hypothetical protein